MGPMSRAAAVLAIAIMLAASTPALVLGATWSKPQLVFGSANCSSVAATIDTAGRYHLAASCGESIRYAVSDGDRQWTTRLFTHRFHDIDLYPQVATDGDFVYVAYTRAIRCCAGMCDDGLESQGVFYRRRSLPDGSWSANRRIGSPGTSLGSFDVADGIIHATTWDPRDGQMSYETLNRGVSDRHPIPGANGTSLRIGTDGRARIAYPVAGSIRYGLFNGSGFWRTRVTGGSGGLGPTLALGEGDRAYLLWTHYDPGSCGVEPVPSTRDGTYFATNPSGKWASERLTTELGATSLVTNVETGRVHGLLASDRSLTYYTRSATGVWNHTDVVPGSASSPVIRQDQTTGLLLVAFISQGRVNVLTKP